MADSTVTAVNPQATAPVKVETQVKPQSSEVAKTVPPEINTTTQPPQSNEQGKKLDVVA